MIRINLLPVKRDRRKEAARNQLLILALVLVVEAAIVFMLHLSATDKVEQQRDLNQREQAEVEQLKKQVADHPAILAEITDYEKRQAAIEGLQSARTGPVYVLLELSSILSKGGRPTINHDRYQEMIQIDPASGYDENWDYRKVWIDSFKETEREYTIKGQALTHEDVAELLRRINLSDFFTKSELISTDLSAPSVKAESGNVKGVEAVVHFELTGNIRYQ